MRRHPSRRLFLTAALIAAAFCGRTPADPVAPGTGKAISLPDLKPSWQVGDRWVVETATLQTHLADERHAATRGKTTRWHFAVSCIEKLDGRECYRLEVAPRVAGRPQPKTRLWLERQSLALRQFQTQIPVAGGFRTVIESYRFAGNQASPVMTPLVALPVDMPLFVADHAKAVDSFAYESVIGPPGQKDVGAMRFAFEIRQSSTKPRATVKGLLTDDFSKRLESHSALEVKLEGFDREVRQLWQPGLPWPTYADNGVTVARLVQVSPAH